MTNISSDKSEFKKGDKVVCSYQDHGDFSCESFLGVVATVADKTILVIDSEHNEYIFPKGFCKKVLVQ